MIRYKNRVSLNKNRNGEIQLQTDMGQTWNTTIVKEYRPFGEWLISYNTQLRQWQKDMMDLVHQAFNTEYDLHPIELYWAYQKGTGYSSQNHDVAFARIPSKHIWLLMTNQHTWIKQCEYSSFTFTVEEASGSVLTEQTRDLIWDFRDFHRHGKTFPKKRKYTDQDYVDRGLTQ